MRISFFLLLLSLATACVKDDAKVSQAGNAGGNTGSSTGGSSTGSSSSGGTDPLASQAWHLENSGQNSFSQNNAVAGFDLNVKNVHNVQKIYGKNIRVAVSDSGVEINHPDLNDNVLTGEHRNYALSLSADWLGADPSPAGNDPHGTAVTGLIAAEGWNNIGSRGVAPGAKFAAFKYVYGTSSETTASRKAKEIDSLYGDFDIFNMSFGKLGYIFVEEDDDVSEAVKLGVTTLRNGKGTNYIQSAGNSRTESYEYCDPTGPLGSACVMHATGNSNAHEGLATPYKIIVSAMSADGKASSYATTGSNVWVASTGGEDGILYPAMISTDISGCSIGYSYRSSIYAAYFDFGFNTLNPLCDYTNRMNGTSAAAPATSGVVALMLEANPNLSWRDVKHILAKTATHVDFNPYDPVYNLEDHPRGYNLFGYTYDEKWTFNKANYWFSNTYGFGLVNAGDAVTMAKTWNTSTLGTFEQTKNNANTWYYRSGLAVPLPITDESPFPTIDEIWVGHDYVIEAVQISFTSDHPFPGDLAIHLVSPLGTESRLLNINNKIAGDEFTFSGTIMLSNAFYGESSLGNWQIKVYDGDSLFGTGNLIDWKILISGHKKAADVNKPYPPVFLSLGLVPVSDSMTPVFNFSASASSSSVWWYEAAVGLTPDDESVKGWTNVGLSTANQQLTGLSTLNDGQTYYLKLRARSAGGYSTPQVKSWSADTIP